MKVNITIGSTFLILCISKTVAKATLILMIYNDNAIYFGSDSQLTFKPSNETLTNRKISILDKTCCASIDNFYGGPLTNNVWFFLPDKFRDNCQDSLNLTTPVQSKITNIIANFYATFKDFMVRKKNKTEVNCSTGLIFCGYDNQSRTFFGSSCFIDNTNPALLQSFFMRGQTNVGSAFTAIAETSFITDKLLSDPSKQIADIRPPGLLETFANIQSGVPLKEEVIKDFMLSLFETHKKFASKFYRDEGLIGPPYLIVKITKEKAITIHD